MTSSRAKYPLLLRSRLLIDLFTIKIPVTVLLILGCIGSVQARDWVEYRSENFTLYSDAREKRVEEILYDFESFRLLALSLLNMPATPEKENLIVVMYNSNADYSKASPSNLVVGFYYQSYEGPKMVIGAHSTPEEVQQTLYHEYIHHLMYQRSTLNYPRWYSEGMATFSVLLAWRKIPS